MNEKQLHLPAEMELDVNKMKLNEIRNDTNYYVYELDDYCLGKIIDYSLSGDINSSGEAFIHLRGFTGDHLKRNYKVFKKIFRKQDEYISSSFDQFVKSVEFDTFYVELKSNEYSSLVEIDFKDLQINAKVVKGLHSVLPQIKFLNIYHCQVHGNFHNILKHSGNIQKLHIYRTEFDTYEWMLHEYPSLKYFRHSCPSQSEITHVEPSLPNSFIMEFLAKNPNVDTVATTWSFIEHCKDNTNINIKLDTLEIDFDAMDDWKTRFDEWFHMLNLLYEKGFYKTLSIDNIRVSDEKMRALRILPALESLSLLRYHDAVANLVQLKELNMIGTEEIDWVLLATKLVNLTCLRILSSCFNDILPIVRNFAKLKKLKACCRMYYRSLDLVLLNKERAKLQGACKLIVYVPDKQYVATKFAAPNGCMNRDLVEIRRYDRVYIKSS